MLGLSERRRKSGNGIELYGFASGISRGVRLERRSCSKRLYAVRVRVALIIKASGYMDGSWVCRHKDGACVLGGELSSGQVDGTAG